MKIENVKNVVPYILKWAEFQSPNYECFWEFNCGSDSWFPWDFNNSVDWVKATSERYIGVLNCSPFYGHYDSDEVHDYNILFVDGKIACVSLKVGDRSEPNFYWKGDIRAGIMGELIRRYPNVPEHSPTNILNDETSEKISQSHYMSFVTIDGELYQFNHNPFWGRLGGNGKILLMTGKDKELELVGEVKLVKNYFRGEEYKHGRHEYHMVDGSIINGDEKIHFMFQKVEI
jgi:hypothetical protein